jgi:hypothetical protein
VSEAASICMGMRPGQGRKKGRQAHVGHVKD